MNIERRSALGLSVAALMGGMISAATASPRDGDADLIQLCNELTSIGSALREIDEVERQTDEQEEAIEAEISRLFREEDRVAKAICTASPPRTLDGFSAMARAAISVSPLDIRGEITWDHCTTIKLSEHMLRALADRELVA